MLKILLALLIITNLCHAVDYGGIVLYNETLISHDDYETDDMFGGNTGGSDTFQNIFKVKYYNQVNDDLFFNVMVANRYTKISDDHYNDNVMKFYFEEGYTSVESLYLTYQFYTDWYMSIGIFPFTNGSYSELSELGTERGTGLIKIIDTPIEAIFLMHKGSFYDMDTITRIGYGKYKDRYGLLTDAMQDDIDDTESYYLTYDVYNKFDSLKINLFHVNYKKEDIDLGKASILGVGYNKYLINHGLSLYTTLAVNRVDLDLEEYGDFVGVPPVYDILFPGAFDFTDSDPKYSYLYSLGVSKDIDVKHIESYNIGAEYTRTGDGWISLVNRTYTDNQNFSYAHGNNIFTWVTARFTPDVAIKLYYGRSEQDDGLVVGNTTRTVPFSNTPSESLKVNHRYGLKFIIQY